MGGLPDAHIYTPSGEIVYSMSSQHMPLGILGNDEFDSLTQQLELQPGWRILVCTDGVTEARNEQGVRFGENALKEAIKVGADDVLGCLESWFTEFLGDKKPDDDVSILEIDCDSQGIAVEGHALPVGVVLGEAELFEPLFRAEFFWGPVQLRSPEPLTLIRDWVRGHSLLGADSDIVLTIVCELFSNAVEHGILGLDSELKDTVEGFQRFYEMRRERLASLRSGHIRLELELLADEQGAVLYMLVSDSGSGYRRTSVPSGDDLDQSHGRGLQLVEALCSSVSVTHGGSTVRAVLPLGVPHR